MMLNLLFAGEGWTYKSSIDQSYQQYGAYYDHVKKKLEFQNQPKSKVKLELTHNHHHHHPYVRTLAIHLISSGNGGLTSSITLEISEETSILDYQFYLITTTFLVAAYQE